MDPRIQTGHPDLAEFLASYASSEEHRDSSPSAPPEPRPPEELTDPFFASFRNSPVPIVWIETTLLRPDPQTLSQNQLAPQPVAQPWIPRAICFGRGARENFIQWLLWENRLFVLTPLPDDVGEVGLSSQNGTLPRATPCRRPLPARAT